MATVDIGPLVVQGSVIAFFLTVGGDVVERCGAGALHDAILLGVCWGGELGFV
jgi:hypothetical protein